MSTLLVAASNAAQGIIKNVLQGSALDDDEKLDFEISSKGKTLDFGYDDDEKDLETEEIPQKMSTEIEVNESSEQELLAQEDEEEEEDVSELLSEEMELALANVRKLASYHQESLVNDICDIYASFNGTEPTVNDLSAVFGRIKRQLAEEAEETDSDESDDDDESDSDYSPSDGEDNLQLLQDLRDLEAYENEESESDDGDDDADSDYDPKDAADQDQAVLDEQYDNESDEDVSMESVNPSKIDYSEDTIINSENFDDEYFAAMEYVTQKGQFDRAEILKKIKQEYEDILGEEATNEIILEAYERFVSEEEEVEEEEVEEEEQEYEDDEDEDMPVDPEELDSAMSHIRQLAKKHQSALVDNISNTFKSLNGVEPTEDELLSILDLMKNKFADEARDDFLDQVYEEKDTEKSE